MQCRSTDANLTEGEPGWWQWERWLWGGTRYGQTARGDADRSEGPNGAEVRLRCADGKLNAKSHPRRLRFTSRFAVVDVSFGDVESDGGDKEARGWAPASSRKEARDATRSGSAGVGSLAAAAAGLVDGETCLRKKSVLDLRVFDFGVSVVCLPKAVGRLRVIRVQFYSWLGV
ncbi:hypothetical protein B0H13DRAFT_1852923 [Mycena leptocephala]|nr:hypothetical protein B0H13DRAFT_1852923 [Mycena leptocephala]